jgi:hypothetical protein
MLPFKNPRPLDVGRNCGELCLRELGAAVQRLRLLDVGRNCGERHSGIAIHLAFKSEPNVILAPRDLAVCLSESELLQPSDLARMRFARPATGGREVHVKRDSLRDFLLFAFCHTREQVIRRG